MFCCSLLLQVPYTRNNNMSISDHKTCWHVGKRHASMLILSIQPHLAGPRFLRFTTISFMNWLVCKLTMDASSELVRVFSTSLILLLSDHQYNARHTQLPLQTAVKVFSILPLSLTALQQIQLNSRLPSPSRLHK